MATTATVLHGVMANVGKALGGAARAVEQEANQLWPNELPKPENIIELVTRGFMPLPVAEQLLRSHGVYLNFDGTQQTPAAISAGSAAGLSAVWTAALQATSEQPTEVEMRAIANRNLWPDQQVVNVLGRYGYYFPTWTKDVANLRYDIPGPSDLVRFSVRHVWEPDILSRLGYDAEFPGKIIDYWHAAKGLDYPLFTGPFKAQIEQLTAGEGGVEAWVNAYAGSGLDEPTWAKAYWWSHWILPSPQQACQMWFRLDPERDRRRDAPEMVGQDFSFDDLKLLLRANDYAPKWRPLLAAICRPIPGIRFVREFCRNGVYDYNDLLEWARRWGYSPQDQRDIADDIYRSCTAPKQRQISINCFALIKRGYEVGIIADNELEIELKKCLLPDEDPKPAADDIRYENALKRVSQVVSSVRSLYLKGRLSKDEASQRLADAGVTADHVSDDLVQWDLERLEQGREATIAEALKWACQGFISLADFVGRAANLGYAPEDQRPLVAQVQQCQAGLLAKAAATAAKQQAQTLKAQQQAIKAQAQALRQQQRDLASHGSPGKLREWYCQGFLTEADLYGRLRYLGWPDSDITRLVGDCKGVRDAKLPGLLTPPG